MKNDHQKDITFNFQNKNIVVIGGTSGIGAAVVEKFYHSEANVIFCGTNQKKGEQLIRAIKTKQIPSKLEFIVCDIAKQSDVNNLFTVVYNRFSQIDFVFNNAGITGNFTSFENITINELNNIMDINFFGIWRCLQKEITYILEKKQPASIVNMASTSGLIGSSLNMSSYVASKHALIGLTKSLALEYAKKNIRVNAICPGFVATEMIDQWISQKPAIKKILPKFQPIGRIGTTDEICNYVLFLLSDAASYITGACSIIDGGLTTYSLPYTKFAADDTI